MENFWQDCLEQFKQELSSQQFNTWIKPIKIVSTLNSIQLLVPNRFVQQWIKDKFLNRIVQLAEAYFNSPINIQIEVENTTTKIVNNKVLPEILKIIPNASLIKTNLNNAKTISGLNPNFTFEQFIPGKANELARAAALKVAESPGQAYNPLFIYGKSGLGKTHLIQAIGNFIQQNEIKSKISYLHAERYVSDVVNAYRHKSFDEFKKYYHSLDLLLIDDIQFFSGKNRTQEEFFYAFNALTESHKQVIITCDTMPKTISGIEERLTSRFSSGLTVEIEPPERELRVAILQKKASAENINLSHEVAFFIAKQIKSNVRELEGALKRIIAYSSFTNQPINIELAKESLKDILAVQNRQISFETIQKTVADYYKIKLADMFSKKRTRIISRPRQIAMLLTKELTQMSYPDIGDAFGGRNHTTVIHAVKTISELRNTDTTLNRDFTFLLNMLQK